MPLLQLPILQYFVVIQQIKAYRLHRCANDWMTYIPAVYLQSDLNNTNIIIHWYYYHSYYLTVNNVPNYVMCSYGEIVYMYIYNMRCKDKRGENIEIREKRRKKNNFSSYKKKYRRRKNQTSKVYLIPIYIFIYTRHNTSDLSQVHSILYIIIVVIIVISLIIYTVLASSCTIYWQQGAGAWMSKNFIFPKCDY